jgi:hypothetical protein
VSDNVTVDSIPLTQGSTYRFTLDADLDVVGTPWDLTAATVTLTLISPAGIETDYDATVAAPASAGIAYADVDTTDFQTKGWKRVWEVDDGAVVQISLPVSFEIIRAK